MIWVSIQTVITTTLRRFPLKYPPKCSVSEIIATNVKSQHHRRNQEPHAGILPRRHPPPTLRPKSMSATFFLSTSKKQSLFFVRKVCLGKWQKKWSWCFLFFFLLLFSCAEKENWVRKRIYSKFRRRNRSSGQQSEELQKEKIGESGGRRWPWKGEEREAWWKNHGTATTRITLWKDRYGICTSRSDGIYQVSAGASSGLVLSLLENSPVLPRPLSPSRRRRKWRRRATRKEWFEEQGSVSGPSREYRTCFKQQWCWLLVTCSNGEPCFTKPLKKFHFRSVLCTFWYSCPSEEERVIK